MKTRYIEDDDIDTASDREISLSPSTLLGIFFLLALICAVFFGFGYSMGRRSATATPTSASADTDAPLKSSADSKPAPGMADGATPADAAASSAQDDKSPTSVDLPAAETSDEPKPALQHAVATPSPAAAPKLTPAVAVKTPAPRPAVIPAAAPAAPTPLAGPPALVQIAAVSHQEDADILVNALKKRGYTVAVRHEPQDKLLHIQLGPFPSRKDADVMRKRLIADGYNAIVK
ncbi:MAG TPA: SPOR domain-containing protein [Edaphobacter sp.]|nr:SPOR domain-containing protein [Edaphobacter sp.]